MKRMLFTYLLLVLVLFFDMQCCFTAGLGSSAHLSLRIHIPSNSFHWKKTNTISKVLKVHQWKFLVGEMLRITVLPDDIISHKLVGFFFRNSKEGVVFRIIRSSVGWFWLNLRWWKVVFARKWDGFFFFTYLITFSIQQVMFTSFLIFKHLWL